MTPSLGGVPPCGLRSTQTGILPDRKTVPGDRAGARVILAAVSGYQYRFPSPEPGETPAPFSATEGCRGQVQATWFRPLVASSGPRAAAPRPREKEKVDGDPGLDAEADVPGHSHGLIPTERVLELFA